MTTVPAGGGPPFEIMIAKIRQSGHNDLASQAEHQVIDRMTRLLRSRLVPCLKFFLKSTITL